MFKTNVNEKQQAELILKAIHHEHSCYVANFDLQDCDKILRIKAANGVVMTEPIIMLINRLGYRAVLLE